MKIFFKNVQKGGSVINKFNIDDNHKAFDSYTNSKRQGDLLK